MDSGEAFPFKLDLNVILQNEPFEVPRTPIPFCDLTSWKWTLNQSKAQIHYGENNDTKYICSFLVIIVFHETVTSLKTLFLV